MASEATSGVQSEPQMCGNQGQGLGRYLCKYSLYAEVNDLSKGYQDSQVKICR